MLSVIVSLVNHYEKAHGNRPNLLYMNETHYEYLREEMPGAHNHRDIVTLLGIDIALTDEAMQPHVATASFGEQHILVS
ncbi:MAG: hypothetical protein ACYCVY_03635 [Acidiferrobacteraceae bacterium]|jgi:hypothetical protein